MKTFILSILLSIYCFAGHQQSAFIKSNTTITVSNDSYVLDFRSLSNLISIKTNLEYSNAIQKDIISNYNILTVTQNSKIKLLLSEKEIMSNYIVTKRKYTDKLFKDYNKRTIIIAATAVGGYILGLVAPLVIYHLK